MLPSSPRIDRPVIGVAGDVSEPRPDRPRCEAALAYFAALHRAGALPVLLPPIVELIPAQLALCNGFVITGGDDPRTEPFGKPTHPRATPMHPLRQRYDAALIDALLRRRTAPTLGVCLGMQMMALVAGGDLDQHLPDMLATHAQHAQNSTHSVRVLQSGTPLGEGESGGLGPVVSHHRQAVRDPGGLRVIARSEDGVIEAIDDPQAPFVLGVQWHPERTPDHACGAGIFERLVMASARSKLSSAM